MSLIISKFKYVCFTPRKRIPIHAQYFLNSVPTDNVSYFKYLGVYFTEYIRWTKHVEFITSKASRTLNFLRRNFPKAPANVIELLNVSHVRTILEYACAVRDPKMVTLPDALAREYNRTAHFFTNDYDFHYIVSAMKESFQWETLERRRLRYRLELFYRIYINTTCIDKKLSLHPPYFVSARCHHNFKVRVFNCHTKVFQSSFFFSHVISV